MTDVTNRFFRVAATIVHALGPTWQVSLTDNASQIIAFPIDRTVYLRFVRAGGAAPTLAVEIVNEHGSPVAMPPDPVIWLLPFDMAAAAAARQLKSSLIAPCRSGLKGLAASAAQLASPRHLIRLHAQYVDGIGFYRHVMSICRSRRRIIA